MIQSGQTIVLIHKSGGDFKVSDALLLAERIRQQNCRSDASCTWLKIICFTNTTDKILKLANLELHPLPYDYSGWWAKMNLFSPELEQFRPFLYMDLDTAVVGQLDGFLPPVKPEAFIMLKDFHAPNRPASGLMWIPDKSDKVALIWNKWIENPCKNMDSFRGDQDFLRSATSPDLQWQNFVSKKLSSFKPTRKQWLRELPSSVSIVCFHGYPRPRQAVEVSWVEKYINGDFPTKVGRLPIPDAVSDKKRIDASAYIRPWFSILCPTRGRPAKASHYVDSIYATAKWPDRIETLFYIDEDDPKLNEYIFKLHDSPAKIIVGPPIGVGPAWNVLARASDGMYLMMGNDDLEHVSSDWDFSILNHVAQFPDEIVLAYVNDGINGKKHCAFPIVSRRWIEEVNEFVPEHYIFFRHDTDVFETAKQIGNNDRVVYIPSVLIAHNHFSKKAEQNDNTYRRNRNNDQNEKDKKTYESQEADKLRKRKARRFRRVIYEDEHFNGTVFRDMVEGKRVALVGPSPHLQGSSLGSIIDKYDVICRVNEILPFGLEKDYGSRTDVLFYGCNENNFSNFKKGFDKFLSNDLFLPMFVVTQQRKTTGNILAQHDFIKYIEQQSPKTELTMISRQYWDFWHKWIGTHPNTGILALCMLADAKPKELFLTGFSFYCQGTKPEERHSKAYIKYGGDEEFNEKTMKIGHDQNSQKKWFINHFVPAYGRNLVLDSFLYNNLEVPYNIMEVIPIEEEGR